jgi:hypothetical protein
MQMDEGDAVNKLLILLLAGMVTSCSAENIVSFEFDMQGALIARYDTEKQSMKFSSPIRTDSYYGVKKYWIKKQDNKDKGVDYHLTFIWGRGGTNSKGLLEKDGKIELTVSMNALGSNDNLFYVDKDGVHPIPLLGRLRGTEGSSGSEDGGVRSQVSRQ